MGSKILVKNIFLLNGANKLIQLAINYKTDIKVLDLCVALQV
jgi:hypothetical protein